MIQIQITKDLTNDRFQAVGDFGVRIVFWDEQIGERQILLGRDRKRKSHKLFVNTDVIDDTKVLEKIGVHHWRYDVRAEDWIGWPVAEACELNRDKDKTKLSVIVKKLITSGLLTVFEKQDKKRQIRKFVKATNFLFD
jgi:hypothetical protein